MLSLLQYPTVSFPGGLSLFACELRLGGVPLARAILKVFAPGSPP